MRYRDLGETRKRQIRYGALAAAVLLMGAGVVLYTHRIDRSAAPTTEASSVSTAGKGTRRAAAGGQPTTATADAASGQASSGDDVTVVNAERRDAAVALIGQARRQAAAGNYDEANASLAKADKAVPNLPETQQTRDDIARLKTPEGQFANDIQRARLAVDHDDRTAAETALAEAAKLRADAPEIAELRAELKASQDKKTRREARIAEALASMREAVARHDFAAANSALNQAERIDMQEPAIRQARSELVRAQNASE